MKTTGLKMALMRYGATEQLAAIQKWQVEEMGNDCQTCQGDNAVDQCSNCGWWGKCPPENKAEAITNE